jgi:hypothetical protein
MNNLVSAILCSFQLLELTTLAQVEADLNGLTAASERLQAAFGIHKEIQEVLRRDNFGAILKAPGGHGHELPTQNETMATPPAHRYKFTSGYDTCQPNPYTYGASGLPRNYYQPTAEYGTPKRKSNGINTSVDLYGNQFVRSLLNKKNLAAFESRCAVLLLGRLQHMNLKEALVK